MPLTLLGRSNSINVQKVLWCLSETGDAYERVDAGGAFGFPKGYSRLNPANKVPTLIDGEVAVWESNTILRYLASRTGESDLYPREIVARSRIDAWMDWQGSTLLSPMRTVFQALIRNGSPDGVDAARGRLEAAFAVFDQGIEGRQYVAGDQFSLADIVVGVFVHRWYKLPIERPSLPNIERWHALIALRDGYRTHIDKPLS